MRKMSKVQNATQIIRKETTQASTPIDKFILHEYKSEPILGIV